MGITITKIESYEENGGTIDKYQIIGVPYTENIHLLGQQFLHQNDAIYDLNGQPFVDDNLTDMILEEIQRLVKGV